MEKAMRWPVTTVDSEPGGGKQPPHAFASVAKAEETTSAASAERAKVRDRIVIGKLLSRKASIESRKHSPCKQLQLRTMFVRARNLRLASAARRTSRGGA